MSTHKSKEDHGVRERLGGTWEVKIELPRIAAAAGNPGARRTMTVNTKTERAAKNERDRLLKAIENERCTLHRKIGCIIHGKTGCILYNESIAPPAPADQTLSEWVREWLDVHMASEIERKTWEGYEQNLRLHVLPTLGNKRLPDIGVDDIEALYRDLKQSGGRSGKGLHKTTLGHIHHLLVSLFKDAMRLDRHDKNPAALAKRGKRLAVKERTEAKMQILDPTQLRSLLDGFCRLGRSIKSAPYPLIALALDSGARRGELLALRWADIDLDKRTIRIERAVDETKKHGVRVRDWPKNKSSIRTVTISASTVALLREEWKRQAEDQLKFGQKLPAGALVFPASSEIPTEPLQPHEVSKAFGRAAKRMGLPIRFHDLRHNCASYMLRSGRTIPEVAAHLGHASNQMVLECYGHEIPAETRRKGLFDEMGIG